jgi:hypothetical protein
MNFNDILQLFQGTQSTPMSSTNQAGYNLASQGQANQLALGQGGLSNQLTLGQGALANQSTADANAMAEFMAQLGLNTTAEGHTYDLGKTGLSNNFTLGQGALANQSTAEGHTYDLGKTGLSNNFTLGQGALANQSTAEANAMAEFMAHLGLDTTAEGHTYDLGKTSLSNNFTLGQGAQKDAMTQFMEQLGLARQAQEFSQQQANSDPNRMAQVIANDAAARAARNNSFAATGDPWGFQNRQLAAAGYPYAGFIGSSTTGNTRIPATY